jgi:hypothetical protein
MFKSGEQLSNKPLFSLKEVAMILVLFSLFVYMFSYIMELETKLAKLEQINNISPCNLDLKIDRNIGKPSGKG